MFFTMHLRVKTIFFLNFFFPFFSGILLYTVDTITIINRIYMYDRILDSDWLCALLLIVV